MVSPAAVKYSLVGAGLSALVLALLQALLTQRLNDAEIKDLVYELNFDMKFAQLALNDKTPAEARKLTGLPLLEVASPPVGADPVIEAQTSLLRQALCQRKPRCPLVLPSSGQGHMRGAWVELFSENEPMSEKKPVWLFVPLHSLNPLNIDPELGAFSVVVGTLAATMLFLWREVQTPLRNLEESLEAFGKGVDWSLVQRGSRSVERVKRSFFNLTKSLELQDQERSLMLAGVAHDLKTPLTRLRLRLAQGGGSLPSDLRRAEVDLDALERITEQFLLFAGSVDAEPAVAVNLDAWLAEVSAPLEEDQLVLDLECMERRVQPTALGRAVGNLIDNCLSYGRLPLRLVLRSDQPAGKGFRIEVWDRGEGISPAAWEQALQPFHRLDSSRCGQSHCGLGLAIALRVAKAHGGALETMRNEEGFAVVVRGRSL